MKKNIVIRPYKYKDCDQVREVCLATGTDPIWKSERMQKLLLTAFCNYYVEQEPDNCFVAEDGENIIGYILCAQNAVVWEEQFKRIYIPPEEENLVQAFYEGVFSLPLKYAIHYPAHLHINIRPEYQRMGIGFTLMHELVSHLRKKNVSGLMLSVAKNNVQGQNFYRKYGFQIIESAGQEIIMGIELNNYNYTCNPVNINYRYQFNKNPMDGKVDINREAADPSMILFQGKYYIFASMTLDVLVSKDMVHWENRRLPDTLPLYGYAPDARVCGDYIYFSANENGEVCSFYRTKDILKGPYEKVEGAFVFSDPSLFMDDNGKIFLYWGLSCKEPIYGVELDSMLMQPKGEKIGLIWGEPEEKGFERIGEDNITLPCSDNELMKRYQAALNAAEITDKNIISREMAEMIKDMLRDAPYIEGAWMNKFHGKYYLQYAAPGTQFNVYSDGVYVSDNPLGPFVLAENNPYSFKPGGFFQGAGHGSTMEDRYGNLWHASTMRISVNHQFERRLGIWPAGIDSDGELFCNQRYGDWPIRVEQKESNPWSEPEWYLLSYKKKATSSSFTKGYEPENTVDENVRTWWQASGSDAGEWLEIDLGKIYDVHAVQINFADDKQDLLENLEQYIKKMSNETVSLKEFMEGKERYIDEKTHFTRWILEGAGEQENWFVIKDKSGDKSDLSHDLIVDVEGMMIRYLRLTIKEVPYDVKPCISGLRVFGYDDGIKPAQPDYHAVRTGDLDMQVSIQENGAVGYNILWGHKPEKLYHSYMVFGTEKRIGALVKGQEYYIRVDAFNESGITEGVTKKVKGNRISRIQENELIPGERKYENIGI